MSDYREAAVLAYMEYVRQRMFADLYRKICEHIAMGLLSGVEEKTYMLQRTTEGEIQEIEE